MTCCKFLMAIVLLSLGNASLALPAEQAFHVRSAYTNDRGEVVVVVELPQRMAPKASDFHLLIDDQSVTAKEIHGQDLDLTLLVDVSGSMKGRPLSDVKAALSSLVDSAQARPKDRFELVSFGDKETILSELKQPRPHLKESIEGLQPKDKTTKLYQALYNSLGKPQPADLERRRVVIVISDGKDEGSEVMWQAAIDRSKASGTPIHAVFRGEVGKEYADKLLSLADATGGRYHATVNRDELASNLNNIYQLETRSFLISFTYDRDPSGKTTEAAAIEFRPAGGSPLSGKIGPAIPMIHVPSPPPYPIWLFVFFASVLLILMAAIVIWRRREKPPVREKVIVPASEFEPVVIPPSEPAPPRHVATQVISYEFPAPQPGQPTAMLIGVGGPAEGQQYSMEREIFRIGAGAKNDLTIEQDDYVSTQHAYLRYEKGSLFIFDQTSRNGTFVNDSQVGDIGLVLRPGDRIRVGMSIFEVAIPSKFQRGYS